MIDQALVDRVTPRILELQAESREPITVYIDSFGGSTESAATIRRLLSASDQDSSAPCRTITVVTGWAASAAADLLFAGDYALVFPEAQILYHGVRDASDSPITAEHAYRLTESLRKSNDSYAMELALGSFGRFLFRYELSRPRWEQIRQKSPGQSDLGCFTDATRAQLTRMARETFAAAVKRNSRYIALFDYVTPKAFNPPEPPRFAELEARVLRATIDYALEQNPSDTWSFRRGGLASLEEDFALLSEYYDLHDSDYIVGLAKNYRNYFLTNSELADTAARPEDEREARLLDIVMPRLRPVWVFFVSLCHALQEDENRLTPRDAFALGLIDEVIGATDLVSARAFIESVPDQS